jgi:hypothetical protein
VNFQLPNSAIAGARQPSIYMSVLEKCSRVTFQTSGDNGYFVRRNRSS